MLCGVSSGQVFGVERFNEPVLHPAHVDFPRAQFVCEQRADLARFKDRETVAVCGISDDDITAFVSKLIGQPLDLFHTVGLMIHRHHKRELRANGGQHGEQVNFSEEFNEQVSGGGTAIHDDKIRLFQGGKNAVERPAFGQVEEAGIGVKPFQRRVLIIAVNRNMGDAFIFKVLDKVDGEETFTDTALAVKDENQFFHSSAG